MEKIPDDKNPKQFACDCCHYYTSSSKDFKKHLLTKKHETKTVNDNEPPKPDLSCHTCGKVFKSQSGLWKHNKKSDCLTAISTPIELPNNSTNQLLEFLLKENNELKKIISELTKNNLSNSSNNVL